MSNENTPQKTTIGELRYLKSLSEEIGESLRSQREILKKRGMSLPPMAIQTLSSIEGDLKSLERAVLEDQTELGQLRALADTTALISTTLDLDMVLHQAMDVVINLTGAERGYIILVDQDTGELDYRIRQESELLPQQGGSGIPQISQTILREVLETGDPLLTDNAYKDERLQGNVSIANLSLRSVLCVPLKYKGTTIGVVYVDNRLRSGLFEAREKNLLVAFANQASVTIENARLYSRIQLSLAEISETKELIDNVFASIGSGVITTDAEDNVTMYNRAASQILERPEDKSINQPVGSVLQGVSSELNSHLATVRETNERQLLEAEMEMPVRGRIAVSIKLNPLKDAMNKTQGVALVLDDLTEKKQRDETIASVKRYLPPELIDNIHAISQMGLGGERREVTCVFIDVRGLSTFPAEFRPPQIMEMLNLYLSRATACVHRVKGVIDKYMGNEIMALFNTQLNPMENDHAVQAVIASLDVRDAFLALYKELGISPDPHFYRIGMHTGIATLGNVGSLSRREFTALGDTINSSKRLEENAEAGQIIISQDTYDTIHAQGLPEGIRFEDGGALQVKGRVQKIPIYEVFRA
ncbi:MAG: adenylate/guanylate cyclase domain-containing protein [Aggregatilineales bacterium]